MWNIIANISSITTLVLFVLYIIGHIWKIILSKASLQENFAFEDETYEIRESDYFVDFTQGIGQIFSVSSPNGIRTVKFYEVEYDYSTLKILNKTLKQEYKKVGCSEKVFAKIDIPDSLPRIWVEIQKNDYVKIQFGISDSGKDESLEKYDYKCKLTFMSFLYYICS